MNAMEYVEAAERAVRFWEEIEHYDQTARKSVVCFLIDCVAGQEGKTGYAMMKELMPVLRKVGNELGVAE